MRFLADDTDDQSGLLPTTPAKQLISSTLRACSVASPVRFRVVPTAPTAACCNSSVAEKLVRISDPQESPVVHTPKLETCEATQTGTATSLGSPGLAWLAWQVPWPVDRAKPKRQMTVPPRARQSQACLPARQEPREIGAGGSDAGKQATGSAVPRRRAPSLEIKQSKSGAAKKGVPLAACSSGTTGYVAVNAR
ncbi:hypothetical protein NUW54_g8694 [Trametes sanguinea]|uniref:Uncharacterized protein n=1 Tax=Trametes sanguinea TaxID=158606 RepID=A0ACC1PDU8_9APHY|nr:hypothetical protein NUW54_g8694 [Trametes sanguinea]